MFAQLISALQEHASYGIFATADMPSKPPTPKKANNPAYLDNASDSPPHAHTPYADKGSHFFSQEEEEARERRKNYSLLLVLAGVT